MYDRILPASFLAGVLLFLLYFVTFSAPTNFPAASLLKIPQGSTIYDVAYVLKEKHLIRSQLVFEAVERLYGAPEAVVPGEYFFPLDENVFTVARRLVHGDRELKAVRVEIPDGSSSKDIAAILDQKLPDFDSSTFLANAQPKEGMLFPDTYFFLPGEDPNLVIDALVHNFQAHISEPPVAQAIQNFGQPIQAVITMASIVEKEAPDSKNREIIAGILWHRLQIGMPLQVDAVFPYIIGVNSLELTRADLATSSPYNTYTHKGLPPGAIANPSLGSILAAVMPTKTNYLYYLSDRSGTLHYSATYAGQLANERKYLGS